jgi:hypothetical protein
MRQQLRRGEAGKFFAQPSGLPIQFDELGPFATARDRGTNPPQRFEPGRAHTDFAAKHALNLCECDHLSEKK